MDISFNDGSLDKLFVEKNDKEKAKKEFEKFVEQINNLKKNKIIDNMFASNEMLDYPIVRGYTINDWLADKTINSNHRQFFRAFLGKAIYIDSNNVSSEVKIKYLKYEIDSLGCAFSMEYSTQPTVISVLSNEFFVSDILPIRYSYLDNESDIHEEENVIKNLSAETNIENILEEEKTSLFSNIASGQDFWENREKMFPNLIFCDSVKKQVYEDCEKYHIVKVIERLNKMQEYFAGNHTQYNPKELGMEARTESDSVKNDDELKQLRLFKLPSGEKKYFFDHIGFTGKYTGGRIHFLPDVNNQRCYIGYIGRHLKTKKF